MTAVASFEHSWRSFLYHPKFSCHLRALVSWDGSRKVSLLSCELYLSQ